MGFICSFFGGIEDIIICFGDYLTFSKIEFVCSFFGGIEDTIICFRDYLTFNSCICKAGYVKMESALFLEVENRNFSCSF